MPEQAYKQCSSCGEDKPLEDGFHRNRGRKDGRCSICKECAKARARAWEKQNPERHRENSRRWEEQNRSKTNERLRRYRQENPDKDKERTYKWMAGNPEKHRAHWELRNAILRGEVEKPNKCEECRAETPSRSLHGHHYDYSKPLDVEWLCVACHAGRHRKDHARG